MSARERTVHYGAIEPPTSSRPGSALLIVDYPRRGMEPVRVAVLARTDHEGRSVTIRSGADPAWDAALVWATLRWSPGDGPPDLVLWWGRPPPDLAIADPTNSAGVSDVALLASDTTAQQAVRALLETLPPIGRPAGRTLVESDEQIRRVVPALKANQTRVTQRNVATFANWSPSALRNYLRLHGRKWADLIDT